MIVASIVLLLIALLLSACFSGSETAVISLNRYKLEHLERSGNRKAGKVKEIRSRPERFLPAILVGNTFVNAAAASLATFLFGLLMGTTEESVLLATVTVTVLLLIFGENTPKTFASHHPERASFLLYPFIQASMWLLAPFVFVISRISSGLLRLLGQEPTPLIHHLSMDEFQSIVNMGAEEATIDQTKKKMLSSIFEISKKSIKEVMIPRTMVTMIEVSTTPEKVLETIVQCGYSRIPVYEGHEENVVGIAHTKDFLGRLQRDETLDIGKIIRKPFFIPASAPVETALREFQKAKSHMGIVVDEYGGFEGIVTLEDLIEEIVGEIQDEHDDERDYVRPQDDGSCVIEGGTAIYKINERLALGLPEDPGFSTLAGFMLSQLGRIPKEKEEVEFAGHRLIVEKVARRTIAQVRLIQARDRGPSCDAAATGREPAVEEPQDGQ